MAISSHTNDAVTITQVNGKSFVSGLLWKPLRSARNYMAEAKAIGKREGMNMVAIRRGKVLQAGFSPRPKASSKSSPKAPSVRGMYSLAAALAGTLGDDWIAAFEIGPDTYAFIAVHRGGVLPGRDIVGGRAQIDDLLRETYSDMRTPGATPRVIAPQSWGFGGEEASLEALLPIKHIKSEYRLKPLTFGLTTGEILSLGVLCGAISAAAVGGDMWLKHRTQLHAQQQHEAAVRALKAQKRKYAATAATPVDRPWQDTPTASDFLQACATVWNHVPLVIGGWQFNNGRCVLGEHGGRVKDIVFATYHRGASSTAVAFKSAAESLGATPGIFDAGQTGTVTLNLKVGLAGDVRSLPLPGISDQMQTLITRLQSIPQGIATYTLKAASSDAAKKGAVLPGATWSTVDVEVKSALAPDQLFAGMPSGGLRFYEIAVALDARANLTWTMKGEMYGRK